MNARRFWNIAVYLWIYEILREIRLIRKKNNYKFFFKKFNDRIWVKISLTSTTNQWCLIWVPNLMYQDWNHIKFLSKSLLRTATLTTKMQTCPMTQMMPQERAKTLSPSPQPSKRGPLSKSKPICNLSWTNKSRCLCSSWRRTTPCTHSQRILITLRLQRARWGGIWRRRSKIHSKKLSLF